jgi:hypothetical protein
MPDYSILGDVTSKSVKTSASAVPEKCLCRPKHWEVMPFTQDKHGLLIDGTIPIKLGFTMRCVDFYVSAMDAGSSHLNGNEPNSARMLT